MTYTKGTPLVDRYAAGPAILAYAVAGLTREQETAHPGPGDWSIAELVGHLLETDLVYAERMKRVLAENEPPLLNFDEAAWNERLGGKETPVAEALEFLAMNRRWMTRILRRCVDADFARAGTHSVRGRETLAGLLSGVTNHADHHLRFLYGKRAKLGVALPPRYGREMPGA